MAGLQSRLPSPPRAHKHKAHLGVREFLSVSPCLAQDDSVQAGSSSLESGDEGMMAKGTT